MIKQIATILFSLFYLLTIIGVQVDVHYCANEVASIALYSTENGCCCGPSAETTDGCCSDESFIIQSTGEQRLTSSYRVLVQEAILSEVASALPKPLFGETNQQLSFPPRFSIPPLKRHLWLLNCSLTYYG